MLRLWCRVAWNLFENKLLSDPELQGGRGPGLGISPMSWADLLGCGAAPSALWLLGQWVLPLGPLPGCGPGAALNPGSLLVGGSGVRPGVRDMGPELWGQKLLAWTLHKFPQTERYTVECGQSGTGDRGKPQWPHS